MVKTHGMNYSLSNVRPSYWSTVCMNVHLEFLLQPKHMHVSLIGDLSSGHVSVFFKYVSLYMHRPFWHKNILWCKYLSMYCMLNFYSDESRTSFPASSLLQPLTGFLSGLLYIWVNYFFHELCSAFLIPEEEKYAHIIMLPMFHHGDGVFWLMVCVSLQNSTI